MHVSEWLGFSLVAQVEMQIPDYLATCCRILLCQLVLHWNGTSLIVPVARMPAMSQPKPNWLS